MHVCRILYLCIAWYLLAVCGVLPAVLYAEQENPVKTSTSDDVESSSPAEDEGEVIQSYSEQPPSAAARSVPPGYFKSRGMMIALCDTIELDGRRDAFYEVITKLNFKDPNCIGCKPFFLMFQSLCKPKSNKEPKKKKKKGEAASTPEPTPTPFGKQRDPHIEVIDLVVRFSTSLYEDEKWRAEHAKVIQRFATALALVTEPPTAQEYFSTIALYLRAPFDDFLEEEREKNAEIKQRPHSEEELDSLF
jgi:hypothetical protein